MVYSNEAVSRADLPGPQTWLTWVEEYGRPGSELGSVRHHSSELVARQYVGRYARTNYNGGAFYHSWVILEWAPDAKGDGGQWVERWSGTRGEIKKDHPLFRMKTAVFKGAAPAISEEAEAAAIASILRHMPEGISTAEQRALAGEGDDDKCRTCGEPNDDGEGWNGECGSCADRREQAPCDSCKHELMEHSGGIDSLPASCLRDDCTCPAFEEFEEEVF